MNSEENIIYRYDDNISFRQCSLSNKIHSLTNGDCTNFFIQGENYKQYYYCNQYGIHLHCTKHPAIELEQHRPNFGEIFLKCPKCNIDIPINDFDDLLKSCLKVLNISKFKDAKLIRLDDWYVPEVKEKIEIESDYWIKAEVKTDRDKDTMVVLYIGNKNSKEKAQFFIKPEKLQLSNDYKDLDPAKILSKIEVTLRDRKIKQEYDY